MLAFYCQSIPAVMAALSALWTSFSSCFSIVSRSCNLLVIFKIDFGDLLGYFVDFHVWSNQNVSVFKNMSNIFKRYVQLCAIEWMYGDRRTTAKKLADCWDALIQLCKERTMNMKPTVHKGPISVSVKMALLTPVLSYRLLYRKKKMRSSNPVLRTLRNLLRLQRSLWGNIFDTAESQACKALPGNTQLFGLFACLMPPGTLFWDPPSKKP